jgi:hypothetical protein
LLFERQVELALELGVLVRPGDFSAETVTREYFQPLSQATSLSVLVKSEMETTLRQDLLPFQYPSLNDKNLRSRHQLQVRLRPPESLERRSAIQ